MDAEPQAPKPARETGRLVAAVVIVAIIVALAVDNRQEVEIGYVIGEADVRLVWLLLITAVLGAVADRLVRWRRRR